MSFATEHFGRLARSQGFANAALLLASDETLFFSGVEFSADGARTV